MAAELGIEDNFENRLFVCAAWTAMVPDPTGQQFLLAADIFFEDRTEAPAADMGHLKALALLVGGAV